MGWGVARITDDPGNGWLAVLVPAIFIPVIVYGRYFVEQENQESFMRASYRVHVWMMVAIAAGALAFVVYLLGSNN